jgi:hypothetical protein
LGKLKNAIRKLFGLDKTTIHNSRFVSANKVVFSSCGNDIRSSDMVKTAIHRVADAVSKCKLRSVVIKTNPDSVERADDDINAVLMSRVNPLCGLKDFLYKVAYLTITNRNCFIYWKYDEVPIADTGKVRRITRGFYPIEAANVKLYTVGEDMRVELTSTNGELVLDMPYSDIIHIRYDYGANAFLGGDRSGRADNKGLLENLQTMHVIKESVPKSLESSMSLKGILSMKTLADVDKKTITRDEFENHLFDSKFGIVATDYESSFTPININATDIPTNVLSFLRDEILSPFGVSLPIYIGKYTDDEYTAFYQTAVEGLLMEIAEAMKIVLFTPRQLSFGHEIKYYDNLAQSLSFDRRQKLAEITKEDALLSRSERRELLGYEPDGEPTRVSLNYIDTAIANQYQVDALKLKQQSAAKEGNTNAE